MARVASISQQIWDMKYRLKAADGAPVDKSIEDSWRRVATALAAPEQDPAAWADTFYDAMADFRFLPAGRILAGAGTERSVTLFNCFVMGTIPDDMGGIFDHLQEAALTMQQGGGIGYDFSTLRPKGAPVKGVGADASGPLSFMDVWDAMCRTIMSAGHRRGAMMATLRLRPPGHRGLHRGQARARAAAHVQPLGPGHRRLHGGGQAGRALGADVRRHHLPQRLGARAVGQDHARDLRLRRAGRDLHRPHQPAEHRCITARRSAPPIPAASSRCRPTAPACSARSTWPGWSGTRSRTAPASTRPSSTR